MKRFYWWLNLTIKHSFHKPGIHMFVKQYFSVFSQGITKQSFLNSDKEHVK